MFETNYVKIQADESSEIIEVPLSIDNTLSHEVLDSQFPNCIGLKYKNSRLNQIRSVRKNSGKYFLNSDMNWSDSIFFCVFPQKELKAKKHRSDPLSLLKSYQNDTHDLIAEGLSYDLTENDLWLYFSRFGPLKYCLLNVDNDPNCSKGSAYFRFDDLDSQKRCMEASHIVNKTNILIRKPNEINKKGAAEIREHKLYISNVSSCVTREDIRAYFSQFGLIYNVYIPKDRKNYAMITYTERESVDKALNHGSVHLFNGAKVNIGRLRMKPDKRVYSNSEELYECSDTKYQNK